MIGRLAVFVAVVALPAATVAMAATSADRRLSAVATTTKCPFSYRADYSDYDLPDRMSRAQVVACRRYFARRSPDGRFAPGTRSFTSQFCHRFVERDSDSREAECQEVRVAVCELAVGDGQFASLRSCFTASPGARVVVHRSPRLSVLVSEPALFDGIWLDFTDNTLDRFFSDAGRGEFYEPPKMAWNSRSGRVVPFPRDLVRFVAESPFVRVVGRRAVRFGGLVGRELDLFVRRGDPRAREASLCGEYQLRDSPCLPISADANDEGYVSLALLPGEPYRLVDLHTRSGRIVVVIDGFAEFGRLSSAARTLRTLREG